MTTMTTAKNKAPLRRPCSTCPWRTSRLPGDFPGGCLNSHALLRMVDGGFDSGVMQCHNTHDERPKVCVGFAIRIGPDSVGFRFAKATSAIPNERYDTDEELHTLRSVLLTHGDVFLRGEGYEVDEDAVVKVEGVCGGSAVIQGTRIPVWSIVNYRRAGASALEIQAQFNLTPEEYRAALNYQANHYDEIEADIKANAEAE